jgi:hypothetical protein
MKPIHFFVIVAIGFFFSSCVTFQKRYLHTVTPSIMPEFKEKGEAFASASASWNEKKEDDDNDISSGKGVNLQGGYAVSKNLAIVGGYNYINHHSKYEGADEPFDISSVNYDRNEISLAVDYFTLTKKKKDGWNLLAGVSFGRLKIDDAGKNISVDYKRHYYSKNFSLFFQPTLNIPISKQFTLSLATKMNFLFYGDPNTNYTETEIDQLGLTYRKNLVLPEFGMKFSYLINGLPVGVDFQLNHAFFSPETPYILRTSYSGGIFYQFRRSKK